MTPTAHDESFYRRMPDGIWTPLERVCHRQDDYDEAAFEILRTMQARHFWYRGRHRFLLAALRQVLLGRALKSVIDLGGGCGGWVRYLLDDDERAIEEIAMGDSSARALQLARPFLGESVGLYQVDLLNLGWRERWDVIFLLDVIEHVSDHERVLAEVHRALRPGGLLFVTTPALKVFWTYNDEFAGHRRRYSRQDFQELADRTGFELLSARYFMFFLSPLLLLSRMKRPRPNMTEDERREVLMRTHRVPSWPVNETLAVIFAAETPIGRWLRFPWGTSILGVFRKG